MNANDLTEDLIEVSKYLLITVFAIFSFTSGPILGTSCFYVKMFYMLSLMAAILSLYFGYQAVFNKINHCIKIDYESRKKNLDIVLPDKVLEGIVDNIKNQYLASIAALILLTITIGIHFTVENYVSVIIK